jgi:hypothetical protein
LRAHKGVTAPSPRPQPRPAGPVRGLKPSKSGKDQNFEKSSKLWRFAIYSKNDQNFDFILISYFENFKKWPKLQEMMKTSRFDPPTPTDQNFEK